MYSFRLPIQTLMLKRKIETQEELSKQTGISTGAISKLMSRSGCDDVNLKTLTRLCDKLGCDVAKLIKDASQ